MRIAEAFSPGHLTGIFQICDEPEDPLRRGARGAGVSIDRGVYTAVAVEEADRPSHTIRINGREVEAPVSDWVLRYLIARAPRPLRVLVEHRVEVPIGAGFSSSGAGALSLALALNEALNLGLTTLEAAQVAHRAEIECQTGLGSVLACLTGGVGVTLEPGAPGVGKTLRFDHSGLSVVYLHLGPISTPSILSDPALRGRINELGGRLVEELRRGWSPRRFMELSRRFAEHLGLITPRLMRVLRRVDEEGLPCTMAMLGETLFSLVEEGEAERLAGLLEEASGRGVAIAGIDDEGARIIRSV
ncbi:MAG: GHMP kinase, N-terminal domain protein [Candidatus Bathyarchaeota archaeon B23]|nr:MAG: GHMP kinase, N-terminal domain protein [Candidatus Bathyarchaeota archaeon B23]